MRRSIAATLTALTAACAGGSSGPGPASAPTPKPATAATTVLQQAAAQTAPAQTAPAEPPKPANIDPSGTYAVSLAYQGQPIDITLYIGKGESGGYAGSISAEGIPTIPLTGIAVNGKKVTAGMTAPDGAAIAMEFTIDGAALEGSWKSAADGSAMKGRKLP